MDDDILRAVVLLYQEWEILLGNLSNLLVEHETTAENFRGVYDYLI